MARTTFFHRVLPLSTFASVLLSFILGSSAFGQEKDQQPGKPRLFTTAQEAADKLVQAAEAFDVSKLNEIFGSNNSDVFQTGEPGQDKAIAEEFAQMARTKMDIVLDPKNRRRAVLVIGNDGWPFAVPIAWQASGKWAFDVNQGRQELTYRRIGRNELDAIDICRGFVEAQHEYAQTKHDGAVVNQYAQRIISTPGKQDGLAWQDENGKWGGAIGERAAAALELTTSGTPAPFHGYYFKVLKGQGPAAPLGQLEYVHKGAMIGGFALLAYPALYQISGVKSFMVGHDGVVYEKDLGKKTTEIAMNIDLYNPDSSWRPIVK